MRPKKWTVYFLLFLFILLLIFFIILILLLILLWLCIKLRFRIFAKYANGATSRNPPQGLGF